MMLVQGVPVLFIFKNSSLSSFLLHHQNPTSHGWKNRPWPETTKGHIWHIDLLIIIRIKMHVTDEDDQPWLEKNLWHNLAFSKFSKILQSSQNWYVAQRWRWPALTWRDPRTHLGLLRALRIDMQLRDEDDQPWLEKTSWHNLAFSEFSEFSE